MKWSEREGLKKVNWVYCLLTKTQTLWQWLWLSWQSGRFRTIGPRFKSSLQQTLNELFAVNCIEKTKIKEKEAGIGSILFEKGKHNTEKSRTNSAPNAPSTEKLKNQIQPRADKIEGRNLFFHYIRSMTPLFYFYWGNAHSLRWLIRSRTLSLFSKVWQKLGVCVIERESLNACLRAIHRYRVWAVVGIKRSKKLPKKKHKHF